MRLFELFDDQPSVGDHLQQAALDILTPMIAHKVPFVSVKSIVDQLRDTRPGIVIDRDLVLSLLDPDKIAAVTKIEGDRIYLSGAPSEQNVADKTEAEKSIAKVKKNAIKQAQKKVGAR